DGLTSKDTAGNTTIVNSSGVSFTDNAGNVTGPSITKAGINAGNKTISNVATAVNGTDAVNKNQLEAAIAAIPTTGGVTTLKTAADNNTTGTVALATQSLVVNGTANYVTTTATGNSITVDLAQSIKDKINTAATVAGNGKDGRDGSNGTAGASITGPTGKDGLNGKNLTDKTNAIRNGEAGVIVYTNDAGDRLVKANDGKYYKAAEVNANGTTVAGATAVTNPVASLVNPNGTTTGATTKLTNIANGIVAANSKEAVNGGQLFDVKQNITNLTNTVNGGLNFKGDTGTQFNRALGTTVNVVGGTTGNGTTNNVVVSANGTDTLTVKLAENIDLGTNGSVTTGKTKISNTGLTSKDAAGNTTVVNGSGLSFTDNTGAATGPSITKDGINAGGKTITHVATAVNGTDAVNLTQVRDMISGIGGVHSTVTAGNNIKVTETPATATNGKVFNVALKDSISVTNVTTTDAAGNTTITNGNGVTITGASSSTNPGKTVSLTSDGLNNGGNQIHNVARGTSADDAATVGQVQDAVSGLNSAFNGLDSKINTTGANAAALAGLKPIQYDPLEPTQIMAAYGHYHDKSAVAVGVAHFTNESTMFHAGVTLDDQNNMFNVGVTKKIGSSAAKKAIPERYKGGPISSVYVMNDEITALKEENARIKQENEDTKAKLAMVMAKLGL
ncbi:YadA-like family protein, partial [Veillonella sp.]